MAKIENMM